ncbi:TIGR02147 family protein [Bdellovibrio sp. HCB337]|uniref:TIGR02147 family protein n=1 Tax=Bdellovibrio sp. HCB337 TaxID=3394358 RepID=UPI0039A43306
MFTSFTHPHSFSFPATWRGTLEHAQFLELVRAHLKSKKMSLRGLALRAQISTGKLSEILSGKRLPSPYYISKISRALKLEGHQMPMSSPNIQKVSRPDRLLKSDELAFIRQWYHLAILNLLKVADAKMDAKWMAKRLMIKEEEASGALQRLLRLKMIEAVDGRFVRTNGFSTTTNNIPSDVIRSMHESMLQKSIHAIHDVPVELRDISYITMAINPKKIGKAKDEIKLFRRKIAKILETDPHSEVYSLCVQLIPLTNVQAEK